ncbi:MAG: AAA family ATPase [Bacteroidota bacterium]|jgi:hypothetical protein
MARIAIRKLKYSGELFEYESPTFDDGINIIEGENGTGKSTFAELLYYCLGGTAEMLQPDRPHRHKEIFSDSNNYVELLLQIEVDHYLISRYLRSNDITIRYPDGRLEILPVHRSRDNKHIFSDWFLEKLGIQTIELNMGSLKWKLNLTDIFRLLYHDQAPNPMDIYKTPDREGFVTDSTVMRKAIFEVLLGKSFNEYYSLLGEMRSAENEKSKVKGAVELYRQMLSELQKEKEDVNITFLRKELTDKNAQLEKLETFLESINSTPSLPNESQTQVELLKASLLDLDIKESQSKRKEADLLDEIIKHRKVQSDLIIEVTQIKKMVYTHNELSLFSADTCPYCLREVERAKGKCVCGSDIDESQYERFFYSSVEYIEILKSKQKSVDTVNMAIDATQLDLKNVRDDISRFIQREQEIKTQIEKRVNESDRIFNVQSTKEVGDKIASLRKEIADIEQQISLESKRQDLEDKLSLTETVYTTLSKKVEKLYAESNLEMDERIKEFNKTYSMLMQKSVIDCRRAYLDSSYMPVINDGEYREASAAVPRRLMYFFTLLHLSLVNSSISFPRFLLIDTPETSGIDKERLLKSFECISEIVPQNKANDFQIILLTGIGKYPERYLERVKQTLTEHDRLLKEVKR